MPEIAKKTVTPCDPVLCMVHQGLGFVCWCGKDDLARLLHNKLIDILDSEKPTLEQIHEIDDKVTTEWGLLYSIRKGYSGYFAKYAYWRQDCGRQFGLNQSVIGMHILF